MENHANAVSRVYAEALFRTAKQRGVVGDTLESLQGLAAMISAHPEFQRFLTAPMIEVEKKKAAVLRALQGNVEELIVDFLCLLIDKEREAELDNIVHQFCSLADEDARLVRVRATTSQPLNEEQTAGLLQSLQQHLQKRCALEANVEPELIGGLVLRIGDKLYDGSVRRQLQRVGDQLMRSSGYEN